MKTYPEFLEEAYWPGKRSTRFKSAPSKSNYGTSANDIYNSYKMSSIKKEMKDIFKKAGIVPNKERFEYYTRNNFSSNNQFFTISSDSNDGANIYFEVSIVNKKLTIVRHEVTDPIR